METIYIIIFALLALLIISNLIILIVEIINFIDELKK